MNKYVIYKSLDQFYCTSLENFNAQIQNANIIRKLENFETVDEIIEYFVDKFSFDCNDFIIDKSCNLEVEN